MRIGTRLGVQRILACCCLAFALGHGSIAIGDCVVPDNGGGTITLPPAGCAYLSPSEVHAIIDGLPPGTTIQLAPIHTNFICHEQSGGPQSICTFTPPPGVCEVPGGTFSGQRDCFDSQAQFTLTGTGTLAGFNRTASLPLLCEVHTAPRVPGQPVQSFDTSMFRMQGQLPPGDPDFDLLRITAGTGFGLPSPGHTTLTQLPGGQWAVDSFFDITYRIDFIGHTPGPLAGMSGSTTATIRMEAGLPPGAGLACCLPSGQCVDVTTVAACAQVGGSPQGPGSSCFTVSCAPPTVACCFPTGACVDLLPPDCTAQGGTPAGPGSNCGVIGCLPSFQACCLPTGACIDTTIDDCLSHDGIPQGQLSNCDTATCGGGNNCGPATGGQSCNPVACPIPGQQCLPTCINYDPSTGQSSIIACSCRGVDDCHAVLPGGGGGGGGDGDGGPHGGGNPCVVADNGGGTVTLPPAGCEYLSADQVHMIIDGLPAGTTIEFDPIHKDFICRGGPAGQGVCSFNVPIPNVDCEDTGGSLGGDKECAESVLVGTLQGTGSLSGFNRTVSIPLSFETHCAPRTPGNPVQTFDTDMFRMFGQITGDPDFDLLRVVGGTDFGLPSPGHTTLTQLPGGTWAVDSFFDITYRIDFVGKAGGPLGGMSGSTTGTIRMAAGDGPSCQGVCPPGTFCRQVRTVQANGTIDVCCFCESLTQACCLPSGTCIETNPTSCLEEFGGTPQGVGTNCESVICPPPSCGPDPEGQRCNPAPCPGDDQICLPTCVNYNPETGQSTVLSCDCRNPESCHAVLQGGGGDGDGEVTPHGGGNPCVVSDNGGGTVTLPPVGCAYLSPDEVHVIINGLPPGTTIEFAPIHRDFICGGNGAAGVCSTPPIINCEQPGGSLGGNQDCFDSNADFTLNGTGALAGYNRSVAIPLSCEVHSAARTPGNPVQSFDTDMFRMFGQITNPGSGDPDFDLLRIVAGTDFGLPSPGHTTLTQLPGGNWAVDSFFDITYRIDFVGKPGGPLSGMSGSTTGTIRMAAGNGPACQGACPPGTICREERSVQEDGSINVCCVCEPLACLPTPDGQRCNPTPCPGDGEVCLPTCINYNPATGQSSVLSCECRQDTACHAVLDGAPGDGDGEVNPHGGGNPCVVTDNGGGTVTLPPAGCAYLSPDEVHMILNGLPAGTTIEFAPIHTNFICHEQGVPGVCSTFIPPNLCEVPGGSMGGNQDCFNSDANFTLTGTGSLAGFNRTVSLPLSCEVHSAARTPGNPVQSFDTDMFRMFGQITNPGSGDPDFDLLRVVAGTDFGLPSPGHTTLTQLPGGTWAVDSFFDITYRIDFVGKPGGALSGMSGSTTGTIRMATGRGSVCQGACPEGTICREERTVQEDGSINVCCICEPLPCGPAPGGQGCNPSACPEEGQVCLPTCVRFNPATGQTSVLSCDCRLDTECHATLSGGAPGDGGGEVVPHGGGNPCVVTDNGGGTVTLPPAGCAYLSPDEVHVIIDGLPPGTTIEFDPIHRDFICNPQAGGNGVCSFVPPPALCEQPGGALGGQHDCFSSTALFSVQGTGALAGFNRTLAMGLSCEVNSAPRTPGNPVQSFDTEMFRMFGQITNPGSGDPDFDLLRITAGTDFGLPSPGHTTLTQLPGGTWAVDSFFDITYRIDFVGKPGGPLGGMSGSTTGTIRMATGDGPSCQGACPPGTICDEQRSVNPDGTINLCCICRPICTCPGDVFEDGVLNGKDIQAFVNCLLGVPTPGGPINCACVDFDGNGPGMSDVPLFVQAVLTKQPCPPG